MNFDHASREDRISAIMRDLVAIPSVTGTVEEARAADWIRDKLAQAAWFQENPDHLRRLTHKLPEANLPMEAVFALVRARKSTAKTLLLIGHFDVVDVDVYGGLREMAYDPESLKKMLRELPMAQDVQADLDGDNFIFGRGVMDMKAGVAIEMDILEEFSAQRDLYDINVAMLVVGDEEGNNGGMRAAVPFLSEICSEMGLEIEAVINTEPSDAGLPGNTEPVIFTGTMGKVMPFFYALGRPSHVGNYFQGLSSALLISRINALLEGNPDMADEAYGEVTVPPICLAQGTREREYSVTIPDRAYAYFNYVTVGKTPLQILEEMVSAAQKGAVQTVIQLRENLEALKAKGYSGTNSTEWDVPVVTFEEIRGKAAENPDYQEEIERFLEELPAGLDLREKGLRLLEKTLELAGTTGPMVIVGMLPPFLPQRTSLGDSDRERALRKALDEMKLLARNQYDISFREAVFFAGLCDLSYVGSDMKSEELRAIAANTPGWGALYAVPLEAMKMFDCPVVNIGPEGRDAHKMTERLETGYSFKILPHLLRELILRFPK